jgi:hypothetical protein
MQVRNKMALAVATIAVLSAQAHAQLIAYEGFNYVEDPGTKVNLLPSGGGTGWVAGSSWPGATGTNPAATVNTGLSFPGVNNNVGQAMYYQAGGVNLSSGRAWSSDSIADGVYWYSMMVKPSLNGQGTFIPFRDPTGSVDGQNGAGIRVDRVQVAGVTSNTAQFKAWTPAQASGANIDFPNGIDRTYYVFGRLIVDTSAPSASSNRIWVVQDSGTIPTDEAALSALTTTSSQTINSIGGVTNLSAIWSGRAFSSNAGIGADEFRVGRSYADVLPGLGPVVPTWASPISGDWARASNWQANTTPNGVGATAQFLNASSARTVFTDTPVIVGTLNFAGANRFNLTGNGSLTLEVLTGTSSISVASGSHKLNLPVLLNSNTTTNVAAGAELVIADPLSLNGKTFTHSGPGTVTIISTVSPGTGGGLVVAGSLLVANMNLGGSSLSVSSGQATFGANQQLTSLDITGTGKVDIGTRSVAVDFTTSNPLASLVNAVKNGSLVSTGLPGNAAVAVADNASLSLTSFGGFAVDSTSVLIRRTLKGDATLDGTVNFDDLLRLAASYNSSSGVGWANGDYDYSGTVNFDDLLVLAANYNQTLTGDLAGDWALAMSAVPEPTSLAVLTATGVLVTRRRR